MIVGANSKSVTQTSSQLITDWVTSHTYTANDYVRNASTSQLYVCLSGHSSNVFNTDLASGKWARINNDNFAIAIALVLGS
jgi:hypothetical protein